MLLEEMEDLGSEVYVKMSDVYRQTFFQEFENRVEKTCSDLLICLSREMGRKVEKFRYRRWKVGKHPMPLKVFKLMKRYVPKNREQSADYLDYIKLDKAETPC